MIIEAYWVYTDHPIIGMGRERERTESVSVGTSVFVDVMCNYTSYNQQVGNGSCK